ncbi:PD-(D/E)XK nuclease family protein [Bifidobacterium pseudolongum]|uniref:PD-(D/E)XK nuclease family protein n=1 Tax=Bifidobacterium pseudolongum TaxID=1694 RepID=UPI0010F3C30B|nr:PD-(D/E)XK nuclease family protein [Bifidobacterium pseudolongum]RYQ11476.1 ATP-dependent DNA helicase UvrD [Bifidobacterium pseudolongum subsp. globosum]
MTHNTASAAAPQAGRAVSIDDALAQARATLDDARFAPLFEAGGAPEAPAVLVTAPPRRGRTMLAVAAAMRAMDVFGESAAVLAVPNRVLADEYSPLLIRHAGVSTQARPATTLNALAFRLITQARARAGLPLPKLLNGAEQDALLRRVLGVHLAHVQAGEMCATCQLLRDYFANEHWARYVAEDMREGEHGGDPATTEALFSAGVNGAFTAQLRDMLARMDESGAGPGCEQRVLAATDGAGITGARLAIQWRLAFALRAEYIAMIGAQYPNDYRLDSSYLQVAAADAAREAEPSDLPAMLVVDDFHDTTLAGLAFLEALHGRGVRLLLTANPDESVQTFRGSYPEYVCRQAQERLHAEPVDLGPAQHAGPTMRELLAARVSLSIAASEAQDLPLPQRPGKMPELANAFPIRTLPEDAPQRADGTVRAHLYRSANEELDDVVWHIKTERLTSGRSWNSMAVIMHDNGAIRALGDRLRRDGVPVRFSSVTRPLAEEPFVQALFALIELAQLRNQGLANRTLAPAALAAWVGARVRMITASPLLDAPTKEPPRPMDMGPVQTAMRSLQALAQVAQAEGDDDALAGLIAQWADLAAQLEAARAAREEEAHVRVDESIVDPAARAVPDFGEDAMMLMLAHDGAPQVIDSIERICGTWRGEGDERYVNPNAPARRFARLWSRVGQIAGALRELRDPGPQFALEAAWEACGVARDWQEQALFNTPAGRAANDRLDTAMRLFEYARTEGAAHTIGAFIEQVRGLQIEADSLAHVAPVDEAVTVTTPAGAAGHAWPLVWLPGVQQDVWPNLAARNTMFGGEDLVDVLLHGRLDAIQDGAPGGTGLQDVLASEQKSLLVALTRASERVTVSAVLNDDLAPSDFLYTYLPERFDRSRDANPRSRRYTQLGDGAHEALDADVRGLIALARTTLATHSADAPEARDAIEALAVLAKNGFAAADPGTWPFLDEWNDSDDGAAEPTRAATHRSRAAHHTASPETCAAATPADPFAQQEGNVVTLSPSKVDRLWNCPVCARMEQQFFGPQRSTADQNFGTIVHDIACEATQRGWDRPGHLSDLAPDERIGRIADDMFALYEQERDDPLDVEDMEERFRALAKDDDARGTFGNIAAYFVNSNLPGRYELGSTAQFEVGTLTDAKAEVEFTARFGVPEVTRAYNAISAVDPVSESTMVALMGALVGGWPDGMSGDLVVRLTGRIDREETRVLADGTHVARLVDYKTGRRHSGADNFNDLQLVCYQLSRMFPEEGEPAGMPIAQSTLFDVQEAPAPAMRGANAETYFQEPLFRDGAINAHAFTKRPYVTAVGKLFTLDLPDEAPAGVPHEAWRQFMALRGTVAVWALTMIARVFYTAAASRSVQIEAHPTAAHAAHCRLTALCPACNGRISTVFETRED